MFKELPEHEKEVYQEMARQDKANKRYQPARNDRMDCTGEYISVSSSIAKEELLIELQSQNHNICSVAIPKDTNSYHVYDF